jgi:hypothetical protein
MLYATEVIEDTEKRLIAIMMSFLCELGVLCGKMTLTVMLYLVIKDFSEEF